MEVTFFNRYYYPHQISIEKLFSVLKVAMQKNGIVITEFTNPYFLNPIGIIKALLYFRSNQSKINHITGDITWSSFLLKGKSLIITIHDLGGMKELSGIRRKIFFIWWIYLPIKKAKFVTVISQKTKEDILKYMPNAANKIKVIPNCFTAPKEISDAKTWNSIPSILIVGTRQNKNIESVFYALQGFNCTLHIVGKLTAIQIELLQRLKIVYTNYEFVSDKKLVQLYSNSDILTFVSKFEGFGLPILEANAQNCVVITSNIEPMLEVAGNAAYFVNPYSVESIATGIKEVWQNVDLRSKLIQNGKENLKRFEVEQIANQYIDLYKQINNSHN
jgi:glycosyltransferase involved in cell wall biosynthesis